MKLVFIITVLFTVYIINEIDYFENAKFLIRKEKYQTATEEIYRTSEKLNDSMKLEGISYLLYCRIKLKQNFFIKQDFSSFNHILTNKRLIELHNKPFAFLALSDTNVHKLIIDHLQLKNEYKLPSKTLNKYTFSNIDELDSPYSNYYIWPNRHYTQQPDYIKFCKRIEKADIRVLEKYFPNLAIKFYSDKNYLPEYLYFFNKLVNYYCQTNFLFDEKSTIIFKTQIANNLRSILLKNKNYYSAKKLKSYLKLFDTSSFTNESISITKLL